MNARNRHMLLPVLCLVSALGASSLPLSAQIIKITPNVQRSGARPKADGLVFTYTIGTASPPPVTASLTSNLGSVPFTVSVSGGSWLSVTPTTGTTPATLTITVDPTGLAAGTYSASYTVQTSVESGGFIITGTDTSSITLDVLPAPASTATVLPASLSFTGTVGQPITPQTTTVASSPSSLGYTATPGATWLTASPASGTTGSSGAAISVQVSASGLTAGTYNSTLSISVPGGTPSSLSVPVQLVLSAPPTVNVTVPGALTFTATVGGTSPSAQTFNLVAGSSNLAFTASVSSGAWLGISAASGTTPTSETVTVDPTGLAAGTYQSNIQFQVTNGNPSSFNVAVTFILSAPPPTTVTLLPTALTFNGQVGSAAPSAAGISLQTPAGTTAMAFAASVDVSWLTLTPTSGTTPSTIQVTPSISGLSAGTLTGHITLSIPSAANPSITVTVTLNLASAPTASVAPSAITLQGTAGTPPTSAPTNLFLSTNSSQAVTYNVSSSAPWLVLGGSTSGSVTSTNPAVILVTGDPTQSSLTQGTYSGTITLTQGSITSTVPVTFTVAAQPIALSLDKQQLNVTANAGGTSTSAGSIYLTTTPGTLAFTAVSSAPWLTVTPSSGTGSQTLSLTVSPSSLGIGSYQAAVTVTAGSATASLTLNLTAVAPNAPTFTLSPANVSFTQTASLTPQPAVTAVVGVAGLTDSLASSYSLLQWTAAVSTTDGGTWLASSVNTSQLPFTVQVSAAGKTLTAGKTYSGTVTITAKGGTTATASLPVSFTLSTVPNSYAISPASVAEQALSGQAAFSDSIVLTPAAPGLQYTVTSDSSWLTVPAPTGSMPATVSFNVNPSSLSAGFYTGKLTIVATGPSNQTITGATQTVTVSLAVTAPAPPTPVVTQGPASFAFQQGQFTQFSGLTSVLAYVSPGTTGSATGSCSVACPSTQVTVATSTPWLQISTTSFLLSATSPIVEIDGSVYLSAAPATPGGYNGQFTISTPSGVIFTGSANLFITGQTFALTVSPSSASATVVAGSSLNQQSVNFGVQSASGGNPTGIPYSLSSDSSWLQLSSSSGTALPSQQQTITANIDATKLSTGTYVGTITVHPTGATSTSYDQFVTVDVNATTADTVGVSVTVSPINQTGAADGHTLTYNLVISNPTTQALAYQAGLMISSALPFPSATIDVPSGTVAADSQVTLHITAKAPTTAGVALAYAAVNVDGTAFSQPFIYSGTASSSALFRTAELQPEAGAACSPTSVLVVPMSPQANAQARVGSPMNLQVLAADNCGSPVTAGTLIASFSNGDNPVPLTLYNSSGLWTASWLPIGSNATTVSIVVNAQTTSGLTGSGKVPVALNSAAINPVVFSSGVVDAADFSEPYSAAPGSIISIFGLNLATGTFSASAFPAPNQALGTTVWLGARQLDLFYVSPTQINAFVPYDLTADSSPQLLVKRSGGESVPARISVSSCAPALFLAGGGSSRPGLVIDTRGSTSFVVGSAAPATAGDILTLYSVGLGPVDQNVGSDSVSPVSPLARTTYTVTVTIGGSNATVTYAGLTPSYVGLYQVNVQVPTGAPKGNAVAVAVTVDGQSSIPVTIPIY